MCNKRLKMVAYRTSYTGTITVAGKATQVLAVRKDGSEETQEVAGSDTVTISTTGKWQAGKADTYGCCCE